MNDILYLCGFLVGSTIKKVDFDFFNKSIKINVIRNEKESSTNHSIEICDYGSFVWLEDYYTTSETFDFKKWDYYEITDITFGNVQANTNDKWLKQYALNYNIVIEIWDYALLIRSNKIIIDGIEYLLDTKEKE